LPKSFWFESGRTLGDGAAIVQGILEIVGGTSAQVGGGTLCITGIGCLGEAPAIVAGVALQVHGSAVASEGLANIAERLGVVFHIGWDDVPDEDAEEYGAGISGGIVTTNEANGIANYAWSGDRGQFTSRNINNEEELVEIVDGILNDPTEV
jgi:hypothetical protein